MVSHWRINIILLGFIFVLSLFVYHSNENEGSATLHKSLSPLSSEDVHSIQIRNKDKKTHIKKLNGTWQITQPISIKANQFRIGSLLKLLTTNNYAKYAIDNLDLKLYGLDHPTLSVYINTLKFEFGAANPVNSKRYVLFNNNMYLIDDVFFPLISSQLGTLVDQNLIPENIDITKIRLPEISLNKDEGGLWRSDKQASADDIINTLDNWKTAQAFSVHSYMPRAALDSIEIYLAGSAEPLTYYVTEVEPWLIIARPDLGLEYHFDNAYIGKLLMTNLTITPELITDTITPNN